VWAQFVQVREIFMLNPVNREGLYVQYGCGFSVGKGWINYDNSPSIRIGKIPVLSRISLMAGAVKFPAEVRFGDVRNGPLAETGTCSGIYASHVLEHLSLDDFEIAIRNTYSMLKPNGIFRLIVPDLAERARRYVEEFDRKSNTANNVFLETTRLGQKSRPRGIKGALRSVFGNAEHRWMWDEFSIKAKLTNAGFVSIRRCKFNDCSDENFRNVEELSRFYDNRLELEELAMECRRPL
jgi:predicted SAM-dependent methyltransferase